MDFVDLLEILDVVQSGQFGVDPSDFALQLQSYRDKFEQLLRTKVLLLDNLCLCIKLCHYISSSAFYKICLQQSLINVPN
jgi:hypothetical protein